MNRQKDLTPITPRVSAEAGLPRSRRSTKAFRKTNRGQHFHDVRELDEASGAALLATLCRVTRAVAAAFPHEGLSLWNSIGEAAFQEVPHLHFHIHPRFKEDGVLRIYPQDPATAEKQKRDEYAAVLKQHLGGASP